MANTIKITRNGVEAVYDDRFLPLLRNIGTVQIERTSDVEYLNGEWVAILRSTGEVIARGQNRNDVIAEEVAWLEKRL